MRELFPMWPKTVVFTASPLDYGVKHPNSFETYNGVKESGADQTILKLLVIHVLLDISNLVVDMVP